MNKKYKNIFLYMIVQMFLLIPVFSIFINSASANEIKYDDFIGVYQIEDDSQLKYVEIEEGLVTLYSDKYNPFDAIDQKDTYHLLLEAVYDLIYNPHLSSLTELDEKENDQEVIIELIEYTSDNKDEFNFNTDYLVRIEAKADHFISKSTDQFKIKLKPNSSILLKLNEDGDLEDAHNNVTFKRIEMEKDN